MGRYFLTAFALIFAYGCAIDEVARRQDRIERLRNDPDVEVVSIPITVGTTLEVKKSEAYYCSQAAFSGSFDSSYEDGLTRCDAALAEDDLSDRDRAATYYNRGYILFQLGRYAEAEDDFTRSIEAGLPQLARAYYNRGLTKQNRARNRDAVADYRKALEIRPDWRKAQEKRKEFWYLFGDPNPYREENRAGG